MCYGAGEIFLLQLVVGTGAWGGKKKQRNPAGGIESWFKESVVNVKSIGQVKVILVSKSFHNMEASGNNHWPLGRTPDFHLWKPTIENGRNKFLNTDSLKPPHRKN